MRKFIQALVVCLFSGAALGQTTAFYTDRAVGTRVVNSQVVLGPIQYGQVRVCTSAATGSPCSPLATIFDLSGNTLSNAIGGNFGQISTDVVGRFTFGCTPGNYLVQVVAQSSNTPTLSYFITCPIGSGTPPVDISFGRLTSCFANGMYVAGSVCYPTLQTAVTAACSTSPVGAVLVPAGSYPQNTAISWCTGVNIVGLGDGQADATTCPVTVTTTLNSGDLFYVNAQNDIHMSNLCISTGTTGANAAIRITAGQRNMFEHIYISGPFARGVQLDSSSTAPASTIWNEFRDIHTTGMAAAGIGLLLDSKDASGKVINGNFFYNFRATGGTGGVGLKLTNTASLQVINENVFWASEATSFTGTAVQVDTGSTRGEVCIDCDLEGSTNGFVKATANTWTFIGGNISANGTNVTDAQPTFTQFFATNVGGVIQNLAIAPSGAITTDSLALGSASSSGTNTINGPSGWQLNGGGSAQAFLDNTGFRFRSSVFGSLPAATNGTAMYCSDCTVANPCAGGGTGALAKRINGAWVCN